MQCVKYTEVSLLGFHKYSNTRAGRVTPAESLDYCYTKPAYCAAISIWFVYPLRFARGRNSCREQNALFNSALRQSVSIRKDLDQFADSASPSPHLQAQLNASLTSFSRTIDDYGKLAKQEPVQTKQEKAFERLKNFKSELEEYRNSFKRIKSANEDIVRFPLSGGMPASCHTKL